ncbi:MAG TPA: J domain-containing protein [Spirochaetota bacterium]|nr:J domain-containing protein [Spirochaetota bacterium]
MNNSEIFNILGIEKTSSLDQIKKAFRKLVFQYHPDINPNSSSDDNQYINKIIDAYKKAINLTNKKIDELTNELNIEFQKHFNSNMVKVANYEDVYIYLYKILQNISKVFYSKEFILFLKKLMVFLFEKITDFKEESNKDEINSILLALSNLFDSRLESLNKISDDEYKLETLRKNFIDYLNKIFLQNDYLSYRYEINTSYETILGYIVHGFKKTTEINYKKEASCILFITELMNDESFFDKIWQTKNKLQSPV